MRDTHRCRRVAVVKRRVQRVRRQCTRVVAVHLDQAADQVFRVGLRGGKVVRASVGDRYVMEEMRKGDFNFGGEQSGHLIYRDLNTTGDGIVAAVQLLSVMVRTGTPLSELRKVLTKFPQAQRNLRVSQKPPVESVPGLRKAVEDVETTLAKTGAGRVLVRYSGTEPLVRILVEGADSSQIESLADSLRDAFEAHLCA